jgi:hypothetical protein
MTDELTVTVDSAYDERIAALARTINAQAKAIEILTERITMVEETLTRGPRPAYVVQPEGNGSCV